MTEKPNQSVYAFILDNQGRFLTTYNERGLDIPGGHIDEEDAGEIDAIKREVKEETGVVVENLDPLLRISWSAESFMQFFITHMDIEDNANMRTPAEFIEKYSQNKDLIKYLIGFIYG